MKRIFIGGMGRSGTTIALNALYQHVELTAIPIETKFLVEADGFYDLISALTEEFSTASTPVKVSRFVDLMRNKVTGIDPSPFTEQHDLSSNIFSNYHIALDRIVELILHRSYYDDREILLTATRQFLAATFDHLALVSDKTGWVEKTPANYWRVEFLRELYPDCFFVHLLRDPRMIFVSLMEKTWLPQNVVPALLAFENMLRALTIKRRTLLKMPRFVEIRLEDLMLDVTKTMSNLSSSLELSPFPESASASVDTAIKRYYADKAPNPPPFSFTNDEAMLINQTLLPWVIELGYQPTFPAMHLVK